MTSDGRFLSVPDGLMPDIIKGDFKLNWLNYAELKEAEKILLKKHEQGEKSIGALLKTAGRTKRNKRLQAVAKTLPPFLIAGGLGVLLNKDKNRTSTKAFARFAPVVAALKAVEVGIFAGWTIFNSLILCEGATWEMVAPQLNWCDSLDMAARLELLAILAPLAPFMEVGVGIASTGNLIAQRIRAVAIALVQGARRS